MFDFEDFEIEILAWHIVGSRQESAIDLPYARLIAAIQLRCGGLEDCSNCILSGWRVCIFEHGRQEPPAAVLARTAS